MPIKDVIAMIKLENTYYVGPVYYDDKGNSILLLKHLGKDKIVLLKNVEQIF